MREAKIILPQLDRDGQQVEDRIHYRFMEWFTDVFGGFTATVGLGQWLDDMTGKLHREPVAVITIAMEDNASNADTLRDMARTFARDANQVCVYVCYADGHVEFVNHGE